MLVRLWLVAVVVFGVFPEANAQEKAPPLGQRLVGNWSVVLSLRTGVESDGGGSQVSRIAFHKDGTYKLTERSWTLVSGGKLIERERSREGKVHLPGKPEAMVVDLLDPQGKPVHLALAKVEGETLILAFNEGPTRPRSFDDLTESSRTSGMREQRHDKVMTLLVLQRTSK